MKKKIDNLDIIDIGNPDPAIPFPSKKKKRKKWPKRFARIQGAKIDNLTLADIKNLDPRKLSTSVLKTVVGKMTEEANRRIRRMEKAGVAKKSPAVRWLRGGAKHMGKIRYFSAKVKMPRSLKNVKRGKSYYRDQYLKKASDLYTFLYEAQTSSVKGVRKFRDKLDEKLPGYWDLSMTKRKEFWDTYHRLLESPEGQNIRKKSDLGAVMTSSEAQRLIYEEMLRTDFHGADDIIDQMQALLQEEYERMTEEAENAERENALDLSLGGEDEDDTPW